MRHVFAAFAVSGVQRRLDRPGMGRTAGRDRDAWRLEHERHIR